MAIADQGYKSGEPCRRTNGAPTSSRSRTRRRAFQLSNAPSRPVARRRPPPSTHPATFCLFRWKSVT